MQTSEFLWPEALAAIDAATWAAIRKARQTGTNMIVWEDGKIVEITPDQAEAQMRADE
jgi:hypothetical protein